MSKSRARGGLKDVPRAFSDAWDLLLDVYKPEGAARWLDSPQRQFGGRTARYLLISGDDAAVALVLDSIERMRAGAAT